MKLERIDKILITWIIFVLFLVSWPFPDIPEVARFDYFDKIVHMALFGLVAFLMDGSLILRGLPRKSATIISMIAGSAYAGLAEIIQIFAPGRDCSIHDFYAGVIGTVIALIVSYPRRTRKESKQ